MPHAAKPDHGDPANHATRKPGDFARHPKTGAPFVASLTETTKESGRKAGLIVACAGRGIAVPADATIADLHTLLGPRPKMVQYGRPSGFGKHVELSTAIQRNAERREALGLFLSPDVLGPLSRLEHVSIEDLDARNSELRTTLDGVAAKALTAGGADLPSQRGTWFHTVSEHVDRSESWGHLVAAGTTLGINRRVQEALVAAYRQTIEIHGVEILAIEATCVDDLWQLAGTLDRIARLTQTVRFITVHGEYVDLPAGTVMVWDLKSGSMFLDDAGFVTYWRSYAVQLASYQQSRPYDTSTDTRSDWETPLDDKWAIIVHVDVRTAIVEGVATCRLVLVDLEAGRQAGGLCVAARTWERRRDVFSIPTDDLTVSVPVATITAPAPTPAAAQPASDDPAPPAADVVEGQAATGTSPPVAALAPSPTGEVPAAEPSPVGDRRTELLERFRVLSAAKRRAFQALNIPADQLDRIAAALAELERPPSPPPTMRDLGRQMTDARHAGDTPTTAPARAPAVIPVPGASRLEGGLVDDATRQALRDAVKALPADQLTYVNAVAVAARDAGTPIHTMATQRCWELVRAVAAFARAGWDDDIVRDLVAVAGGDDAALQPGVPLGAALVALDVDQATVLAEYATRIERGNAAVEHLNGRWRLVPAAA